MKLLSYYKQIIIVYFFSKLPPWNKLSNAFCTLGSLRILDESFSVWLDSIEGWVFEERDVFSIFKIRFCNCVACGLWIDAAAGRIGTSAMTKTFYFIVNRLYFIFNIDNN